MKRNVLRPSLSVLALLLGSSLVGAPQDPPLPPKKSALVAKGPRPRAKLKVKQLDINSATKEELLSLPGVTSADADKIIAGRPYVTKARLVTRKILPAVVYEGIKGLIAAQQPKVPAK